jgi:hypothetical protein
MTSTPSSAARSISRWFEIPQSTVTMSVPPAAAKASTAAI